jgi:hypothetical protein
MSRHFAVLVLSQNHAGVGHLLGALDPLRIPLAAKRSKGDRRARAGSASRRNVEVLRCLPFRAGTGD